MATHATDHITAGLTPAQREAVTYGEGPLLVVAGAGSGKTRVITRRIAYLLAGGVPSDRMVALTFTNKAGDEMRRRVEALVGEGVYVTTFHSYCARLLRREIGAIGRDAGYTIYDRADSLRIARRLVKDMELDTATYRPRDVVDYIGLKKDHVIGPEQCSEQALSIEEQTLAAIYERYEEALTENNALDFDDLLLKTLEVFRTRPEVLQDYQQAYLHVLVDEYQDTNLPQHLIARALQGKHRNITAVGDPDQMIYSWRGARLENLLEFEEDFPGTHIVKLERNYRSTANILGAAGACIAENELRHEKTLRTEQGPGEPVVVREFADPYDEGRWVAKTVEDLVQDGISPSEAAVFYRTKQQSLPLEDAFATLSLPHQVVDSVGFFDRRAVKDLRGYLQLLVNPRDDEACLRVINTPRRGIGARTVEKLRAGAEALRISLLETVRRAEELPALDSRATAAVAGFWNLFERLRALEPDGVGDLLKEVLEQTGYLESYPPEERQDAQEVVDMLLGYAREYDRQHPDGDLMGFLEQAALVSDVDGWNAQAEAVPFMTLHSAKGLEFDAVFIVGAEEDLLPHRRALDDVVHGGEHAALEEERRLFYVGMTRARERLFITHARQRTVQGRQQMAAPSRFLGELPEDGVERHRARAAVGTAAGFREEMDRVLRRKGTLLRVLEGGDDGLAPGARVRHRQYGEGRVLEATPLAAGGYVVRVDFAEEGPMSLVVSANDVAFE
ncbi:MAG: UvrD-helicase domain-containing protein [Candidatus Brocadiia bacterium]